MNLLYSFLLLLVLAITVSCRSGSTSNQIFRRQNKEICVPRTANVEIKLVGCVIRRAPLKQCSGTCISTDSPFNGQRKCTCCTPIKTKVVKVDVHCQRVGDGAWGIVIHELKEHDQCSCLPCFD
jgi:hypothetical protein